MENKLWWKSSDDDDDEDDDCCSSSSRRSRLKEWRFAVSLTILFFCCLCFYVCNSSETLSESTCLLTPKADNNCIKDSKSNQISVIKNRARRLLGGPGSSPPRCNSKCGKCTPCKPVHVAVPPGTPVTAEYYPEAWRCKCGNKLYMP